MKIPRIPLLVTPVALFAVGFLLNMLVMAHNNGQMPVLFPGGCGTPEAIEHFSKELTHSCMTPATHWKAIADWGFVRGVGWGSPGDLFELIWDWTGTPAFFAWILLLLKDYNTLLEAQSTFCHTSRF